MLKRHYIVTDKNTHYNRGNRLAHQHYQGLLSVFMIFFSIAILADENQLTADWQRLQPALMNNVFNFPIHVTSDVEGEKSSGDIYGQFQVDFKQLAEFAHNQSYWCDALMLNIFVKHCKVDQSKNKQITLYYGSSEYDDIEDTFEFDYQLVKSEVSQHYLYIELLAEDGPADSAHYRIIIEAMPTNDQQSILHLSYTANYGFFARTAMSFYLATLGKDKVGFSLVDTNSVAEPIFIGGLRGVIERNAMRYLLSLVAYNKSPLGADSNLPTRLSQWHQYSNLFNKQLYKLDLPEFLALKLKEFELYTQINNGTENTMPEE